MGLPIDLLPTVGPALVAGGGDVAKRKVAALLSAGFDINVVATEIDSWILHQKRVTISKRLFDPEDIEGHAIVFACTDTRETNAQIGALARAARVPVVVADSQSESTFFTPAVHRDGDLIVAVSTSGASPTLAVDLRDRIVEEIGSDWAEKVDQARIERSRDKRDD